MYHEELIIKDNILFDLSECSTKFSTLRWDKDHTKQTCSPRLTEIGKSPDFHDLIFLCSEHSPSALKPVLQIALEKCAKAEKQMKEEKAKKRVAETQLAPEPHKHNKLRRLDKVNTAASYQSHKMPDSAPVSQAPLEPDALQSGVTANQDSHVVCQANAIHRPSAVVVQAPADSRLQTPGANMELGHSPLPTLHLASVPKDHVPSCDRRRSPERAQDWEGIEYGWESEDEMEYESDIHQADTEHESRIHQEVTDLQETSFGVESHDCNSTTENATMPHEASSDESNLFVPAPAVDLDQSMDVTSESSDMASPLPSSVTASPPSPETILSNNPAEIQTLSRDDVERGLVRGEEKAKEFIKKECICFSGYCRAKKRTSPSDELQELFLTCRKLPLRIVKDRLLMELRNRIKAPGQKTAIPSTADLFNPGDILNALQSIKTTTINAKVNRAYGQMRLFKAVQGKIQCPGYVPDKALKDGVAPHRSILAQMVRRYAGNLPEKELNDLINSCVYEYEGGQRWVDAGQWFGGEGIILVFVTAGEWNQKQFFFLRASPCNDTNLRKESPAHLLPKSGQCSNASAYKSFQSIFLALRDW